ncbi:hypothetical protein FRB93_000605 [Tulasnella sp. JGI-2019a]|nr:hypothetical protein FRB93_000605 [Tulasnella sp. JGI-2019a]
MTLASSDLPPPSRSICPSSLLSTYQRPLSDNELSYFLPSRADGVNDMYLHIGFRANRGLVTARRLALVWAILRGRHPLLASEVVMEQGMYDSARYSYTPPGSPHETLDAATEAVHMRGIQGKDALISSYLNGPRTLSNSELSALLVSSEPTLHADGEEWNVLFCATHFIGDGMALHQTANDFFRLLAGSDSEGASPSDFFEESKTRSEEELLATLESEWIERWSSPKTAEKDGVAQGSSVAGVEGMQPIPAPTESRLPQPRGKMHAAAVKVDFKNSESRLIGGHAFPRAKDKSTRRTVVKTISFDSANTKAALKKCKSEKVTISSALFALCNLAWMRTMERQDLVVSSGPSLPMMMYSALNLRPYLGPTDTTSYWFLSVGYFNVILPTFLSASTEASFWHRARSAKAQSAKCVKSPLLVCRSQEMAKERGKRAKTWAKQDDDEEALQLAAEGVQEAGLKITVGQPQVLLTPPPSPGKSSRKSASSASSGEKSKGKPNLFNKIAKKARRSFTSLRRTMSFGKLPMTPPLTPSTGSNRQSTYSTVSGVSAPNSPSWTLFSPPSTPTISTTPPPPTSPSPNPVKVPSTALMGLSLLGNLDGTYAHASYSSGATLHTLTTGSRQRSGGMLLFGYTFAGKMWISLGWDVNAFSDGVVECFWDEVEKGVGEMLLTSSAPQV